MSEYMPLILIAIGLGGLGGFLIGRRYGIVRTGRAFFKVTLRMGKILHLSENETVTILEQAVDQILAEEQ